MRLRLLILAQLACIAFIGAAARATWLEYPARAWPEGAAAIAYFPTMIGFPVAIHYAAKRSDLSEWERRAILGIEIALYLTLQLAIMPEFQ